MADEHVLDRPIWHALTTRQAGLAVVEGTARRFAPDIGPLAGAQDESDESLADLSRLLPREGVIALFADDRHPLPPGGILEKAGEGVQMVATAQFGEQSSDGLLALGDGDAAEMLALALLTEPGPFAAQTHRLSQFWGIRDNGRLVAWRESGCRCRGSARSAVFALIPTHAVAAMPCAC